MILGQFQDNCEISRISGISGQLGALKSIVPDTYSLVICNIKMLHNAMQTASHQRLLLQHVVRCLNFFRESAEQVPCLGTSQNSYRLRAE